MLSSLPHFLNSLTIAFLGINLSEQSASFWFQCTLLRRWADAAGHHEVKPCQRVHVCGGHKAKGERLETHTHTQKGWTSCWDLDGVVWKFSYLSVCLFIRNHSKVWGGWDFFEKKSFRFTNGAFVWSVKTVKFWHIITI